MSFRFFNNQDNGDIYLSVSVQLHLISVLSLSLSLSRTIEHKDRQSATQSRALLEHIYPSTALLFHPPFRFAPYFKFDLTVMPNANSKTTTTMHTHACIVRSEPVVFTERREHINLATVVRTHYSTQALSAKYPLPKWWTSSGIFKY